MSIRDSMIWHQIHLDRYKNGVQVDALSILDDVNESIKSDLALLSDKIKAGKSKAIWSANRMSHQIDEVSSVLDDAYGQMNSVVADANKTLVKEEIIWNADTLSKSVGTSLSIVMPTEAMVLSSVIERPFYGWKSKKGAVLYAHNSPLRGVPRKHIADMERIVKKMYLTGSTNMLDAQVQIGAVQRAIAEGNSAYDLARRNTQTEIRTGIQTYAQKARDSVLDANSDIFPWSEFTATLDGRTTTICGSLDGRTYKQDDPGKPSIPQHWNCRSTYVPKITKDDDIGIGRPSVIPGEDYESGDDKLKNGKVRKARKGSGKLKRKQAPSGQKFQSWLKEQDKKNPEFVRDYFKTDKRYEKWKSGKLGNVKYTSTDGRVYNIRALKDAKGSVKATNLARQYAPIDAPVIGSKLNTRGYPFIEPVLNDKGKRFGGIWKDKDGKFIGKSKGKVVGVFDTIDDARAAVGGKAILSVVSHQ